MKTCILTANLGNFDHVEPPMDQTIDFDWHCFNDKNFPPIGGLTPRLQYRIPKTHGWQMKPDYDYYIWLDGSMRLAREDSAAWLLEQLGTNHMAVFRHPDRSTARQEADYIERLLQKNHPYIMSRYKGGLHEEQMGEIETLFTNYDDRNLYASTVLVYRATPAVKAMMQEWLYTSVRYFTCDQIVLPYLLWKHDLDVKVIELNPFKNDYLTVGSKHK
jgi:Protein of unknown function (DUF616)